MKFPSVATALQHARATAARFPMAILSGLGALIVTLIIIEGPSGDWHGRLLTTFILALPLFTASVTTAERLGVAVQKRWIADIAMAVGLLLLYRASLGWSDRLAFLRFAQLLIAAHLLVAIAPYLRGGGRRGFWQYNRFLFLRYLVASFYGQVLWIGLAVALAAVDKLFGADVPGEMYGRLAAVLAFGFHPWFFLSGMPRDYAELDELDDYPQGLKVFTQFVLMPLVVIYLGILTAYLVKVIVTTSWPSGWIGYLVSSVSATGVLALLLVHPIRERADSRWVNGYARWLFVALLPALVMLLLAIGKRVDQYAITEPRYFLLVLALWMLGLSLYYGITGSKNIKLLPVTLCAVALLSAAGPWSAYAVARRSQTARFGGILEANGMGRAGAMTEPSGNISTVDRVELSAILRYLGETHGPNAVARATGIPEDTVRAWGGNAPRDHDVLARRALERVGLGYVGRWEVRDGVRSFSANVSDPPPLDVSGFELVRAVYYPAGMRAMGNGSDSLEFAQNDSGVVSVKHGVQTLFTLDLAAAARAVIQADSAVSGGVQLTRPLVVEGTAEGIRVRIVLESFGGALSERGVELRHGAGFILVGGLRR